MREKKIMINYLLYILLFIGVCLVGVTNIFALETKTIYSVNNNGTLSSANTYNYGYMSGGVQNIARATVGNTVNGVAYGFNFSFYENVVLNKTYTLVINFKDSDLLKSFTSDMVQVSTCNNNTCNENILVSVVKNNNSGNSNKLTIQFNPITTGAIILVNLGSDQAITGISTFGISSVTLDSSNQNEDIMNNANQNANNIINNQNSNTQDVIDSSASNTEVIVENQEKIKNELIEAQYTCKVRSITLSNYIKYESVRLNPNNTLTSNDNYNVTDYIKILPNMPYSITLNYSSGYPAWCMYDKDLNVISCERYNSQTSIDFKSASNAMYLRFSVHKDSNNNIITLGGNVCLKDTDENTNAINEVNKTNKGILGKLGDLISYINPSSENFFLKLAFIPSSTFLQNWYNDFRAWIELKLGFLSTPITLFLDFINLYLNLNKEDIIINIPEITVPNFEEYTLIQAQTFNWSNLLESKQEFSTLWNLYLDFIDVFLILNFLGLCEVTYNRIFGGDTSQYEYYTTEETYSINDETGEATNHQLRQRRTRREKV